MKSGSPKKSIVLCGLLLLVTGMANADSTVRSTAADRQNLEVTVYNNNTALVKETRQVNLPKGTVSLMFSDISSSLIPESTIITTDNGGGMTVIEQHFEYDLLSPQKLLEKYVGKKVRLIYRNPLTDKEETVEATIVSHADGTVFQIGNEITFDHPGRIVFPEIPDSLFSSPALIWLLNTASDRTYTIRVTYLTRNINWKADYILVLDETDVVADLHGWVTIDNKSGIPYRNADLKLIAGEIHSVQDPRILSFGRAAKGMETTSRIKEKEFFEYYLYDLDRRSSIKNNQTKQLNFMNVSEIPAKKRYILRGNTAYYYSEYRRGFARKLVGVYIEATNSKESRLGFPLPAGLIRVYSYDDSGNIQFTGEDRIGHTPENEDIRVQVGEAFDIISDRKQSDWIRLAEGVFESSLEVILRNHKKKDIVVTVIEPVPGDWRILKTSHDYRKTDANTLEFDVPVTAGKEVSLEYRIRVIL